MITASSIFTLVVIALVVWVILSYLTPKLTEPFQTVANVLVVVIVIIYLLRLAGLI